VEHLECVKGGDPGGLGVQGKAPVRGLGTKSPDEFFVNDCLNFDILEGKIIPS